MKFYQEQNRIGNLKFQLTQEKVVEFLKEKSTFKELSKDQLTDNKK